MRRLVSLLAILVAAPAAAAGPRQGKSAAFFGITWLDISTEGEINGLRSGETARLANTQAQVADALRASGLALVDLAPVAGEFNGVRNPADYDGCDARMAHRLGADFSVVSEIQKVSNLILSMNVVVRDAATGDEVRGLSVDIRGNTDESWQRGVRFILTRILGD